MEASRRFLIRLTFSLTVAVAASHLHLPPSKQKSVKSLEIVSSTWQIPLASKLKYPAHQHLANVLLIPLTFAHLGIVDRLSRKYHPHWFFPHDNFL